MALGVSLVLPFHFAPQRFLQTEKKSGFRYNCWVAISGSHQTGSGWIRVGLEVFINKSRLAVLSSFPETKASSNPLNGVTSLFPFLPSSPSVAAVLSSGMSSTFTKPSVGPLEVKLTLLARLGNLTSNIKCTKKMVSVVVNVGGAGLSKGAGPFRVSSLPFWSSFKSQPSCILETTASVT